MDHATYIIKFDGVSTAEANRYASELRNALLDAAPGSNVDQKRDNLHTQDFGSILVLVLGTSSVTAIAKAVGNWLQLRNTSLTIEIPEKKIIVTNITGKDAVKLTEIFLDKK